ncbi:MAG: DUF2946 domain-containing protein [Gallionella sp.]
MSLFTRKFIVVLLALWLPLFSGSVLAASVSMQFHVGKMNTEQSLQNSDSDSDVTMQYIQYGDSCDQQRVGSSDTHAVHNDDHHHGKICTACGVCHLACGGYLIVSDLSGLIQQQPENPKAFYLLSFNSVNSSFLLPPPLARV